MANNSEQMEMINHLNRVDKVGDITEGILTCALGTGAAFIIDKAVKKIFTPSTIPEKILTVLGTAALGAAVSGATNTMIHECCHPFERSKKEGLMNNTLVMTGNAISLTQESIGLVRSNQELTNTMLDAFVIPDDISTENLNTIQDVIKNTDISSEEKKDEQ